eukprot:483475-Rhodomonas_salina.1
MRTDKAHAGLRHECKPWAAYELTFPRQVASQPTGLCARYAMPGTDTYSVVEFRGEGASEEVAEVKEEVGKKKKEGEGELPEGPGPAPTAGGQGEGEGEGAEKGEWNEADEFVSDLAEAQVLPATRLRAARY